MMAPARPALDIPNVERASPLGKRKFWATGDQNSLNSFTFENLSKKLKGVARLSAIPQPPALASSSRVPFTRGFDSRIRFSLPSGQPATRSDGTQPTRIWESLHIFPHRHPTSAGKSSPVLKTEQLPAYRGQPTPSRQSQSTYGERTLFSSGAGTPLPRQSYGLPMILAPLAREVHGPVHAVSRSSGASAEFTRGKETPIKEFTGGLAASDWNARSVAAREEAEEYKASFKSLHVKKWDMVEQIGLEIKAHVPPEVANQLVEKIKVGVVEPAQATVEKLEAQLKVKEEIVKTSMKEKEELMQYKRLVEAWSDRRPRDPTSKDQIKQDRAGGHAGHTTIQDRTDGQAGHSQVLSYKDRLLAKAEPTEGAATTNNNELETSSGGKSGPVSGQMSAMSLQRPSYSGVRIDLEFRHKAASRDMEIEALTSKLTSSAIIREEQKRTSILHAPLPEKVKDEEEQDLALVPLSSEANAVVDAALAGGARLEVLATHQRENIDVTRELMHCLRESTWLNDEVINVYLALLKDRELANPGKYLRCHFFNTFFFNKLFKDKGQYDYKSVRRWTTPKKVNYKLHEIDKILVPIHLDIHWCLAVINIREKKFEYLDSLGAIKSSKTAKSIFNSLAQYIKDEAKDKSGVDFDVRDWDCVCPAEIPRQENGCDCGVFMVKYADYHSRNAPLNFSQCNMPYFRRRMVWELIQGKAI